MPPMDRVETQNAWMPSLAPPRPHSPSNAYLPGANAHAPTEARHREMIDHNFATFAHHPDMPRGPAGQIMLGQAHSDAVLAFRHQVLSQPDLGREYAQTYRIQDGRFEPVHPNLIAGHTTEVAMPSGSYPAGTGLVIHSHTVNHATGFPSEPDLLRAYQDRTNALQQPGTMVASHILYNPGNDRIFIYDGSLNAHGHPQFFQAIVPPPPIAQPVPRPAVGPDLRWMQSDSPTLQANAPSPNWDDWMNFDP